MPGGRVTKLNAAVQRRICNDLKRGCTMENAAGAVGVHRATLYDWLRRGREEQDGPFRAFADAVEQARAASEVELLRQVAKAGEAGDWRASAWILERRFPDTYGNRVAVLNRLGQLPPDELDAFIAAGIAGADQLPKTPPDSAPLVH